LAEKVRVVLDNLNTHFAFSFYETFPKEEAGKIDFYYTPRHGSWLNMSEIEINMMDRECLARRIGEAEKLIGEIKHWTDHRNMAKKISTGRSKNRMRIRNYPNIMFHN